LSKGSIYIDKDLLFDGFFEMKPPNINDFTKHMLSNAESLKQFQDMLELCYFMVKTAFMSETRFSRAEREKSLLPLAKLWQTRVLVEKKHDIPDWVSIMYEAFDRYCRESDLAFLAAHKLEIEYTKIPSLRVERDGRIIMNVALLPFLMQINYSYMFFAKIKDVEKCSAEVNQKMLPLLTFCNDPIATSISCLPIVYGLSRDEIKFAKIMSLYQVYYMILHEVGHINWRHVPGEADKITVNSVEASKEIKADIYAYSVLSRFGDENQILINMSIVSLLSFFALAEELKNKMRGREESLNYKIYSDRIYLAKMGLRSAVGKYDPDSIDGKSFEAVEAAADKHVNFALGPLGYVQKTISELTAQELREFSDHFTLEGANKYFKENADATTNN